MSSYFDLYLKKEKLETIFVRSGWIVDGIEIIEQGYAGLHSSNGII